MDLTDSCQIDTVAYLLSTFNTS